jgi:hypothetical protein
LKSPHRCKDYEGRVQTSRVIDPIAFSLMLDRLVKSRLFKHPLKGVQGVTNERPRIERLLAKELGRKVMVQCPLFCIFKPRALIFKNTGLWMS